MSSYTDRSPRTWTPEEDRMLQVLIEEGHSAREAAERMDAHLGINRSRQSLIKRAERNGWKWLSGNNDVHRKGDITVGYDGGSGIPPFGRVYRDQCQWIEGLPTASDSCKCLAPVITPGNPYCGEHAARATRRRGADDEQNEVAI